MNIFSFNSLRLVPYPLQYIGTGIRVGKNPGFFKKTQPSGFFWVFLGFLGFFGFFCPDERVFRFFFVSRIL